MAVLFSKVWLDNTDEMEIEVKKYAIRLYQKLMNYMNTNGILLKIKMHWENQSKKNNLKVTQRQLT